MVGIVFIIIISSIVIIVNTTISLTVMCACNGWYCVY